MIHTDEDDEFARIERENEMRKGQPYHWEVDAIQAAIRIEREACARLCDELETSSDAEFYGHEFSAAIRARNKL